MDDRLARIGETRRQFVARKQSKGRLTFERRAVRRILKTLGADRTFIEHQSEDEFDLTLSFAWFADNYSAFPVSLISGEAVVDLTMSELFATNGLSGRLGRLWAENYSPGSDRAIGIVMDLSRIAGSGWWILHNYGGIEAPTPIFRRFNDGVRVYFEQLDNLVERLS